MILTVDAAATALADAHSLEDEALAALQLVDAAAIAERFTLGAAAGAAIAEQSEAEAAWHAACDATDAAHSDLEVAVSAAARRRL